MGISARKMSGTVWDIWDKGMRYAFLVHMCAQRISMMLLWGVIESMVMTLLQLMMQASSLSWNPLEPKWE